MRQLHLFEAPIWGGYGILTRALLQPDGYLHGVGHRWMPDWCPWLSADYDWREHGARYELPRPIKRWLYARILTTLDLAEGWPVW